MGDTRRFHEFAQMINKRFYNLGKELSIADIAGGKGYLQLALRELGFAHITSFDKRIKHLRKFNYEGKRNLIQFRHHYFSFTESTEFDLVIGMHPDEGTDHIIKYASIRKVPFIVCPCCVKPSATYMSGNHNFSNWWSHLRRLGETTHRIEEARLKINGKNMVLIGYPK